jgi:hypothetical protein
MASITFERKGIQVTRGFVGHGWVKNSPEANKHVYLNKFAELCLIATITKNSSYYTNNASMKYIGPVYSVHGKTPMYFK